MSLEPLSPHQLHAVTGGLSLTSILGKARKVIDGIQSVSQLFKRGGGGSDGGGGGGQEG